MNGHPGPRQPAFDFDVPPGYRWILDRGLIGFDPFGPLQPWHYLPKENAIDIHKIWRRSSVRPLVAFAKRQDNDDYACFEVIDGRVARVIEIESRTSSGYTILECHDDFWSWLKRVIDDISECVDE